MKVIIVQIHPKDEVISSYLKKTLHAFSNDNKIYVDKEAIKKVFGLKKYFLSFCRNTSFYKKYLKIYQADIDFDSLPEVKRAEIVFEVKAHEATIPEERIIQFMSKNNTFVILAKDVQ
jgi:hypothetical protein